MINIFFCIRKKMKSQAVKKKSASMGILIVKENRQKRGAEKTRQSYAQIESMKRGKENIFIFSFQERIDKYGYPDS